MARINEKEYVHQLEYLDHRLTCTRYVEGAFRWKYKSRWFKGWKKRRYKEYITDNHPVGLNYFTIRQLLYILNDIRENYLRETHIFAFGQEKFLVRLIPDKDKEINDYIPPRPRPCKALPELRKQDRTDGLKKASPK